MKNLPLNPSEFPNDDAHFFISGSVCQLETITYSPKELNSNKVVVIVCHPHPLYQGTMKNKVVYSASKAFYNMGIRTVCFNFRGVGLSDGEYGEILGEIDDLKQIVAWVKKVLPDHQIWLGGFSFGSFISASVAEEDKSIAQLFSIAPPVERFEFYHLEKVHCPWFIIYAEEDELTDAKDIVKWIEHQSGDITSIAVPGASHFFHGNLIELRTLLTDHYKGILSL